MRSTEFEFDESVKKALEKWPNVPNCFGWISLGRRGQWLIKNTLITHQRAVAYLARNYAQDEHGRWFIQNGPQRAFCDLEYTPLIYFLNSDHSFVSHTGARSGKVFEIILDDEGNLLIAAEQGLGLLDDRDLTRFSEAVTSEVESAQSNWFDFDYIKKKNELSEQITMVFDGESIPIVAEFKENLEKKYHFTGAPQPLESEI